MKANIIYKLTMDICRDNTKSSHYEQSYDELCEAREELNFLVTLVEDRVKNEQKEGHDSFCNIMERRFNALLPDVDVTVRLVNERQYYKLNYEIKPCTV